MTLDVLGIGYAAIGVAIAAGAGITGRRPSVLDVLLLVVLWPLTAPMVLAGHRLDDPDENQLLSALARASASPLAAVLPDAETARVLASRLREAEGRLAELDQLLARPEFDPKAVERRAEELAARGSTAASATAQLRVRTLGQLRSLRERYRTELDEVRELIAQLLAQAELVRLQPAITHSSGCSAGSELVRELVTRVEGLGDLFAYQATLEGSEDVEYPASLARSG